ncbi:MAG: hypothetical protein QM610_02385 [Chitinophagaceae bacterium]
MGRETTVNDFSKHLFWDARLKTFDLWEHRAQMIYKMWNTAAERQETTVWNGGGHQKRYAPATQSDPSYTFVPFHGFQDWQKRI